LNVKIQKHIIGKWISIHLAKIGFDLGNPNFDLQLII
jgi:hypothetical protein